MSVPAFIRNQNCGRLFYILSNQIMCLSVLHIIRMLMRHWKDKLFNILQNYFSGIVILASLVM